MKTIICFLCIYLLALAACTKTDIKPVDATTSVTTQNNAIAARTPSAILTSHPWMYQGFYFHYVNKNSKGDPRYVRGSANNAINLDDTRITFRKNGTFIEIDGGYRYPGTWKVTSDSATVLIMTYSWGTDNKTVIKLNGNICEYTQPLGYRDRSYTELIPAQ